MKSFIGAALVAATLLSTTTLVSADDGDLTVFDWAGYEDPAFFDDYIEKYGAAPKYAFFSDEEEAFQKIRAGFRADITRPCAQSVSKWRDADMIEPIDTSRLKNWSKVIPQYASLYGFNVDGTQWAVPLDWGATALTYRTDLVPEADIQSLQIFADPKYQGRVSVIDNVDDAYALGFLATGVNDWTKATDADLGRASAFLRAVHKNVRTYWQDPAEARALMSSGEITLSWAWNEIPVTLQDEGVPVGFNQNTIEGSSTWICGFVVLKDGSGSDDRTYDFLDAWLADSSAEYLVTEWGYGHSNGKVMAAIGEENGFGSLADYSKNRLLQAPLAPEFRAKMVKEFELIKAGF